MFALWLAACTTTLPTPTDVGGPTPDTWVRVSSSTDHWRASFPTWPEIHSQPDTVQYRTEDAVDVVGTVVQSSGSYGTFLVASVPQTPGVLAQDGADKITEMAARDTARRVEGTIGEIEPWEGVDGGVRATIGLPERRSSAVVAGLVDGVLVIGLATTESQEGVDAFLDNLHLVPGGIEGVDVALTDGVRARCPAVCGPYQEQGTLGGVGVPLVGARGLVDQSRYEVVVAPLRAGLDPTAAEEELRARFVSRVRGQLADITPGEGSTRARYTANGATGVIHTAVLGNEVVAAEVWSGVGGSPDWTDAFFGSLAAR